MDTPTPSRCSFLPCQKTMAIQAHLYPDNFVGSPFLGRSQDCFFMDTPTTNNNNNFNSYCSNFNDFSFNLQQQQFQNHQQFQNLQHINFNSHGISSQIQKQSQEIDSYVTLQNKRLKMALQEQRRQHLGAILKKVEK